MRTVESIIVRSRLDDAPDAVIVLHPLTRELLARLLALVRAFAAHVAARPTIGSDVARAVLNDMIGGSAATPRVNALLAVLRQAAESAIIADDGASDPRCRADAADTMTMLSTVSMPSSMSDAARAGLETIRTAAEQLHARASSARPIDKGHVDDVISHAQLPAASATASRRTCVRCRGVSDYLPAVDLLARPWAFNCSCGGLWL